MGLGGGGAQPHTQHLGATGLPSIGDGGDGPQLRDAVMGREQLVGQGVAGGDAQCLRGTGASFRRGGGVMSCRPRRTLAAPVDPPDGNTRKAAGSWVTCMAQHW